MTNPSKQKGTAAETAAVRVLQAFGFLDAERIPLKGSNDHGDVRVRRGLHLEVKAGQAAHRASLAQIERWVEESEKQGRQAGCPCYLLVKRAGKSRPEDWRFFCRLWELTSDLTHDHIVELRFLDALDLMVKRDLPRT